MATSAEGPSISRPRFTPRPERVDGAALLESWLARSSAGSTQEASRAIERAIGRLFRRAVGALGPDVARWLATHAVREAHAGFVVNENGIGFAVTPASPAIDTLRSESLAFARAWFDLASAMGSAVANQLASEWAPTGTSPDSDGQNAPRLRAACAATYSIAGDRAFDEAMADALAALGTVMPLCAMYLLDASGAKRQFASAGVVTDAAAGDALWSSLARLGSANAPMSVVACIEVPALGAVPRPGAAIEPPQHVSLPLVRGGRVLGAVRFELRGPIGSSDVDVLAATGAQIALRLDVTSSFVPGPAPTREVQRELLSVVSHDLRNPLSAILMSVALVGRQRRSHGHAHRPAETDKHIAVIKRSAERMNQLLQNLVDAAHLDSGDLAVEPRPEPISSLVEETLRLLESHASTKGVRLVAELPDRPVEVLADRERIAQTLANLVTAALRSTPRGGVVAVRATADRSELHVCVSDSGPGFSEGDLPHLFDRQWWTSRNASLSTGMALAVAKGIVEAHKGRIWAESAPHEGCRVHFTLAIAPASHPHASSS